MEGKWVCAAFIARSRRRSAPSTWSRSTTTPVSRQVTAVFVEQGGKTTLTATVLYPSQEVRDAVIKSGMEHGAAESYDKLAELLATAEFRSIESGAAEA